MPTFRQSTLTDLPTLTPLMRDFYQSQNLPFTPANTTALQELLTTPTLGAAYLIEDNTTPAGYLILTYFFSLERHGKIALLDELYITPTHRNHGLGTAAIDFATTLAHQSHCSHLFLEADHANPSAHALYTRLGFTTLPRHYLAKPLK